MDSVIHPHDSYFKLIFSDLEVSRALLKKYLPRSALEMVDFDSLELVDKSFIKKKLSKLESDIIFKGQINNQEGYLYLLIEHQSTQDPLIAFRLIKYMAELIEQHYELSNDSNLHDFPLIIPSVWYNGKTVYTGSTNFFDLFGKRGAYIKSMFNEGFDVLDFKGFSDELLQSDLYSKMTLYMMKHIHSEDMLPHLEAVKESLAEFGAHRGGKLLFGMLTYIISAGKISDHKKLDELLTYCVSTETKGDVMTYAQELQAKGELIGEARGEELGRQNLSQELLPQLIAKGIPMDEIAHMLNLSAKEVEHCAQ